MNISSEKSRVRITAADIAAHLGIGKSTVAQVLNGRAEEKRISIATRERVQKAARELGYRPNAYARAVGQGRFGSAALIQPLSSIYLPHWLLLGLTQELQRHDMVLTLNEAHDTESDNPAFLPKAVRELAADGLLINMAGHMTSTLQVALEGLNTPVVWINSQHDFDAVYPDDLLAGRMATQHLLEIGHQHIVYVDTAFSPEREPHYSRFDRLHGYEKAMEANRLKAHPVQLPVTPRTGEDLLADQRLEAATHFLLATPRPTALVVYGIDSAFPLLQAAERLGLNVPRDLSLVVCSDDINRHIGRAMTTVVGKMAQVGEKSVQMLLQKIEQPAFAIPSVTVAPWLYEGATTAPPS